MISLHWARGNKETEEEEKEGKLDMQTIKKDKDKARSFKSTKIQIRQCSHLKS